MTSLPFWLMIVSIAMAVLPVPRSPMISSRWPRPIGIIESIALIPVWSGSFTGCRTTMPGATISTWRAAVRRDRAQAVDRTAERVDDAADQPWPTGTSSTRPVRRTSSPFLQIEVVAEDDGADVVLLEVQREAADGLVGGRGPELEHLAGHRGGEAVDACDPVLHLEDGADLLDVGDGQVGGLDLAEQDVLEFAGAQCGLVGHETLCDGWKGSTAVVESSG